MIDLLLKNGVLSDAFQPVDIAINGGMIVEQKPGLNYDARQSLDLHGCLVIPAFIESHLHLDIALMNNSERPGRPLSFVYPSELNKAMEERRLAFSDEDIKQRASRALEMALRHGVTALRAQCQVDYSVGLKHLKALLEVREMFADRIRVQIVVFPQQGLLYQPETLALVRESFRLGADVMGCASNLDPAVKTNQDMRRHIDTALSLAMEMNVDLDLHADLGLPEQVELDDLEVVYAARRAIETGYQKRVAAGHVCALDSAEAQVAEQAITLIREAQISVISQPDMYRLGRADRRGVRRGLTRVKELLAAGVNVTYASNNVRDAFRPLGNFDLLEEGLVLAYGAHMDSVDELETLLRMSTENAARALRLENYGLSQGCHADLVVLDAPSPSAALVGQVEKLYVIKSGKLVAENQRRSEIYNVN
ncbi:MAG: amidohydrolase family protein [Anaerolineae bacterium]|nr:amidohydrolase family protein [Anaerolineae bacterium]